MEPFVYLCIYWAEEDDVMVEKLNGMPEAYAEIHGSEKYPEIHGRVYFLRFMGEQL